MRLLAVTVTSVVEALGEGATLAVVFMAVEVLSSRKAPASTGVPIRCGTYGQRRRTGSPACHYILLALAVVAGTRCYLNAVSVGYFAAECRARVTSRIHSQVLRFSYACSSG